MRGGVLDRVRRLAVLMRDPRMPRLPRLAVILALVYLLSPVDLIPEAVTPIFGFLDDAVVLWLSVRWLFRSGSELSGPEGP
jgi:uncharacterized membrane protein YkvA (DUF1232 family)